MAYNLFWIDLEATGSNDDDPILEVGAVITAENAPWNELDSYAAVCRPSDDGWRERMDDVVREMHTTNGLIDDVSAATKTLEDVEDDLIEMLGRHGRKHSYTIAGSGVGHYDRRLIRAQMPRLDKWLRYPCFDIGNVRRLMKFAGRPELARPGLTLQPGQSKVHRGLDDIRDHIAEAAFYAECVQNVRFPSQ